MKPMYHYYILGIDVPEKCVAIFSDYEYSLMKNCNVSVQWSGNADSRYTAISAWLEDNQDWLNGVPTEEFLTTLLF